MPYKTKEEKEKEQQEKQPAIYFEYKGKKILPPKIKRNKYGEDIVHIGAEIPYSLWQELYADSFDQNIPLMQNVRQILADYYDSRKSKKEAE